MQDSIVRPTLVVHELRPGDESQPGAWAVGQFEFPGRSPVPFHVRLADGWLRWADGWLDVEREARQGPAEGGLCEERGGSLYVNANRLSAAVKAAGLSWEPK